MNTPEIKKFIKVKQRITFYGLYSGLLFVIIGQLSAFIIPNGLVLLYYLPYLAGTIFGIFILQGIAIHKPIIPNYLFVTLSTILYVVILRLFMGQGELQTLKRFFLGSAGAISFIGLIHWAYKFHFTIRDYFIAFAFGLLSTIFIWIKDFRDFNPWLLNISILLWQTSIAYLINENSLKKLSKSRQ